MPSASACLWLGTLSFLPLTLATDGYLVVHHDVWPGADGWESNRPLAVTTCDTLGSMLGGYGVFGSGAYAQKTFNLTGWEQSEVRAGIGAEHLAWACAHLAGADAARPLWRLEAAVRMTGGGAVQPRLPRLYGSHAHEGVASRGVWPAPTRHTRGQQRGDICWVIPMSRVGGVRFQMHARCHLQQCKTDRSADWRRWRCPQAPFLSRRGRPLMRRRRRRG